MSTYIDSKGYVRFKDTHKYVHRWAAEKKLGRRLRSGEVVHHIDRDKTNNHPSNLYVFPNQAAHDRAHKYDANRFGKKASYQGFSSKEENSGCMVVLVIVIALVGVGLLG